MNNPIQKDKDGFSISAFHHFSLTVFELSKDDIVNYLEVLEIFQTIIKPLKEIFPPKESNLREAWSKSGITGFLNNKIPITNDGLELFNNLAERSDLSILRVFKYINQKVELDKDIANSINNHQGNQRLFSKLEESLAEMFHDEKISYLRALTNLLTAVSSCDLNERTKELMNFFQKVMVNNQFSNALFYSYEQSSTEDNQSAYMKKHPDRSTIGKLKEQVYILQCLFSIINLNLFTINQTNFDKLSNLIISEKFSGCLSILFEQQIVDNQNLNDYIKNLSTKVGVLQFFVIITSLQKLFKNKEEFLSNTVVFQKQISKFNNTEKTNSIWSKILVIYYQSLLRIIQDRDNMNQIVNRFDEFADQKCDCFGDYVIELLELLKQFGQNERELFRPVLKTMLELLNELCKNNENQNIIFDETIKKYYVFLKLFKEIFKSNKILLDFCTNEFDSDRCLGPLVKDILSLVPLYNSLFLKMIYNLSGGKNQISFCQELTDQLHNLKAITLEIDHQIHLEPIEEEEAFLLKESLLEDDGIVIPVNTKVIRKGLNQYLFYIDFNFWKYGIRNLLEFLSNSFNKQITEQSKPTLKFIKIICMFLINDPSLLTKIESFAFGYEDELGGSVIIILLLEIFKLIDKYLIFSKTSLWITKAFTSLLMGPQSQMVQFLIRNIQQISNQEEMPNPFSLVYENYIQVENNLSDFRLYETEKLKQLAETLAIQRIIADDENLWMQFEKNSTSNDPIQYQNNINEISKIFGEIVSLQKEGLDIITFNSHVDYLVNTNLNDGFKSLEEMLFKLIQPISKRFLKDDFEIGFANVKLKYLIYQRLFELITSIIQKFKFTNSKNQLVYTESFENPISKMQIEQIEFINKIPIKEIILASFDTCFDSSLGKIEATGKSAGLENKHWVENVHQRNNLTAIKNIKEFFSSALELFISVLNINTIFLSEQFPHQNKLLLQKQMFLGLCDKEQIFKYYFSNFSETFSCNILVSIAILANIDESKNIEKLGSSIYTQGFDKINIQKNELLENEKFDIQFLHNLKPETLFNKVFGEEDLKKPSKTLKALVFKTINTLIKFWNVQKKVRCPKLDEFLSPYLNDLPNGSLVLNRFTFSVIEGLMERLPEVSDFLLECLNSQYRFLENLFRKENDSSLLLFVKALNHGIQLGKENLETIGDFVSNEILFKNMLLIFRLLRSDRYSKILINQLWSTSFSLIIDCYIKYIEIPYTYFGTVASFLFDFVTEKEEKEEEIFFNQATLSFYSLKIQMMLEIENLFGELTSEIIFIANEGLLNKVKGKNVYIFDQNLNFLKNLPKIIIKLIGFGFSYCHVINRIMSLFQKELMNNKIKQINIQNVEKSFNLEKKQIIDFIKVEQNIEKKVALYDTCNLYRFLILSGINQELAEKMATDCLFLNYIQNSMDQKIEIQKNISQFFYLFYSISLSGSFSGSNLNLMPLNGIPKYLVAYSNYLSKQQQEFNFSSKSVVDQWQSFLPTKPDIFAENLTSNPDLQLRQIERAILLPFWNQKNGLGFNLLNILLIDSTGKITEKSYNSLIETLRSKIQQILENIEVLINFENLDQNYIEDLSSYTFIILNNLFSILNPNLEALAHCLVNIQKEPENPNEIIQILTDIFNMVSKLLEYLNFQKKNFDSNIQNFIFSLIYCNISLRVLAPNLCGFNPIILKEFLMNYYEQNLNNQKNINQNELIDSDHPLFSITSYHENTLILYLLDTLFELSPDILSAKNIDLLSYSFGLQNLSLCEFTLICNSMIKFSTSQINQKLSQSTLFRQILSMNTILDAPNFSTSVFYQRNKPDSTHCKFLCLLQFMNQLLVSKIQGVYNFGLAFLSKYQKRFEMLFSLDASIGEMPPLLETPLQFRKLEYLLELKSALEFVCLLSQDTEFWKSKNLIIFQQFLHVLSSRTIFLFSQSTNHSVFSANNKAGNNLNYDKFMPETDFEATLQRILIQDKTPLPSLINTIGSVMKSDPKNSFYSEINRFKEYKQMVMSVPWSNDNLFSFYVEHINYFALFSLLATLANMIESLDFSPASDLGHLFPDEIFFIRVSGTIIDIQFFLLHATQKLEHQETFKESQLRLNLMLNSFEGVHQTNGMVNYLAEFSLAEIQNLVRKAFELSIYVHNLVIQGFNSRDFRNRQNSFDDIKKHQEKSRLLIIDFEKMVRIKDYNQGRDAHSPYTSGFKSVQRTPIPYSEDHPGDMWICGKRTNELNGLFIDFVKPFYQRNNQKQLLHQFYLLKQPFIYLIDFLYQKK